MAEELTGANAVAQYGQMVQQELDTQSREIAISFLTAKGMDILPNE